VPRLSRICQNYVISRRRSENTASACGRGTLGTSCLLTTGTQAALAAARSGMEDKPAGACTNFE
jgi:hypothetical protein